MFTLMVHSGLCFQKGGSLLERPETAVPKSSGRGLLIIAPSTSITYPTLTVPMTQRYSVVVRYEVSILKAYAWFLW